MCLQSVYTTKVTKKFGWKEFIVLDGKLYPFFRNRNLPYKTDRWITDKMNYSIETTFCGSYKTGFHMFRTKVMKYCGPSKVRKVYFKDQVAHDDNQIVARSIYICDKTKRPPTKGA